MTAFTAGHLTTQLFLQVQTTTMCISVSLSGFVVLGCLFAPKVHIILFQPQKNVVTHRLHLNRFSVSGTGTTYSQCKYGTGHGCFWEEHSHREQAQRGSNGNRQARTMHVYPHGQSQFNGSK